MRFIVAFGIALFVQVALIASPFIGAAIYHRDTFLSHLVFNLYLPPIYIMEKISGREESSVVSLLSCH